MDTPSLSWNAPEYIRNPRTADWYWGISLLGIAGVAASVYFSNYLFGVVVLLSAVMVIAYAVKPVHIIPVGFYDTAISISGKMIPYDKITCFWIAHHPREGAKLLLRSDSVSLPAYILPLAGQISEEQVRFYLAEKVPESEITIPILVQLFEELF